MTFIRETEAAIPEASQHVYVVPTDENLMDWTRAVNLFRAGRFDSCRAILAKYNYALTVVRDALSGGTFDVFHERSPVTRGWGTLIFNRNHTKRLNIHVNHPVEDVNACLIGAEMFRRTGATWMLIGGSSRLALPDRRTADLALELRSVFQRWHELVSDLTQISVSLHAYRPDYYEFPISVSDVVISNGRTDDLQWGISQISLAFRDSLRAAGFHTALAMLDSGFARLAGGSNPQGMYSNDTLGFGHWINVELSSGVRYSSRDYLRVIDVADRVLNVTQQSASRQANRAFGLVSPRVVKIDRANRLLFPPPQAEKYRIVSFTPGKARNDTLDLLFGNWFDGNTNRSEIARIVEYDTTGSISSFLERRREGLGHRTLTSVVSSTAGKLASGIRRPGERSADSLLAGEEIEATIEPIQVHRIPLRPVLDATLTSEYTPVPTPFQWGGILPEGFSPQLFTFASAQPHAAGDGLPGLSRFLIPLLKNSYESAGLRFVGVDMTELLVNEIARLVVEYQIEGQEIGLMAEQGENGSYYLRLFPEHHPQHYSTNLP